MHHSNRLDRARILRGRYIATFYDMVHLTQERARVERQPLGIDRDYKYNLHRFILPNNCPEFDPVLLLGRTQSI